MASTKALLSKETEQAIRGLLDAYYEEESEEESEKTSQALVKILAPIMETLSERLNNMLPDLDTKPAKVTNTWELTACLLNELLTKPQSNKPDEATFYALANQAFAPFLACLILRLADGPPELFLETGVNEPWYKKKRAWVDPRDTTDPNQPICKTDRRLLLISRQFNGLFALLAHSDSVKEQYPEYGGAYQHFWQMMKLLPSKDTMRWVCYGFVKDRRYKKAAQHNANYAAQQMPPMDRADPNFVQNWPAAQSPDGSRVDTPVHEAAVAPILDQEQVQEQEQADPQADAQSDVSAYQLHQPQMWRIRPLDGRSPTIVPRALVSEILRDLMNQGIPHVVEEMVNQYDHQSVSRPATPYHGPQVANHHYDWNAQQVYQHQQYIQPQYQQMAPQQMAPQAE